MWNSYGEFVYSSNSSSFLLLLGAVSESFILYGNKFNGQIPRGMGNLDLLQFQAHNNALSSAIPDDFWNNQRLIDLRLDKNNLAGTISTLIGNLDRLVDLRIGDNSFSGTLPSEISLVSNLSTFTVGLRQLLFL